MRRRTLGRPPAVDRSTRPLTRKQIAELRGVVAPSTVLFRAVLLLLVGAVAAKLFHVAQQLLGAAAGSWWWVIPTSLVLVALYLRAGRWTGGRELRRRVRRDLAGGLASALRIEAVSAVEIAEQEDEGPTFVLRTAGGETVVFAGQYLEGAKSRGFPWRDFLVLEAPESRIFFALLKLGEPLAIRATLPPLSYRQGRELGVCDRRYVVLDERGSSILEELGAAAGGRRPGGEHADPDRS